jgi:mannose-6-phosphate isomerase-like protein (cupin superfamily)
MVMASSSSDARRGSMLKPRVQSIDEGEEFLTPERCWILENWNSQDDPALSISRARVEIGVTTQLHLLRDVDERYLVVRGIGEVAVGENLLAPVKPGDVVVIPRNVAQQIRNTGEENLVFYCVCSPRFSPECYENLEAE